MAERDIATDLNRFCMLRTTKNDIGRKFSPMPHGLKFVIGRVSGSGSLDTIMDPRTGAIQCKLALSL
ncbi:hypothetical protein PanWU01x14_182270 [Parasponia andersonii]|uniref:Uncharacterized protein n=1 Tax=Parasponia andersonii TaxID=3476 RepID=A0A2P5C5C0_PARAD|nr:hypothetical protein PanWU01x14_182270 [Parasponia andersonii]